MNPRIVQWSNNTEHHSKPNIVTDEEFSNYFTKDLLNPKLELTVSTIANYYHPKNVAFATAIVDLIATLLTQEPPVVDTGDNGFGYEKDRERRSKWDDLIGYSANEAFDTLQEETILRLVCLDLMKRGFRVYSLRLSKGWFPHDPAKDKWGILVSWRLGYRFSEPTETGNG